MTPNLHLWLIPVLPLVGAALNGLLGRHWSRRAVSAVGVVFCGGALAMAFYAAARFSSLTLPHNEYVAPWIEITNFRADFAFYLDQLSLIMLLVVSGVGFLIHIYSIGYMEQDPGYYRFFSYLNLFMFFMLTLVLANNYLLMFIGWEGVGLASYLLIGFWFNKDAAASAGKKAFIVNRIGDFGFLIGLFLLIRHFDSLTFDPLFSRISQMRVETGGGGLLSAIGLLLMVGACGKSAQIPLHVWLPDAMEGPTPVSALIHAATMVTAGVYMVSRSHTIFERAPAALTVVAIVGVLTALFAATIGVAQTDIKKVLAYSTISQLGYMFLACGVAAFSSAIFHLMTHAFFKGLLFLAAGSVIHALGGEQNMLHMGGLRQKIPWTFWTMTAATFAIAGMPGLSGFFSKDEILWRAYQASWAYWLIGVFTAFVTSFYMFRLWFLTFFAEYRGAPSADYGVRGASGHLSHQQGAIHESPKVMLLPMVILAFLSVIGGWVGIPGSIGGSNHWDKFLGPVFRATAPEPATGTQGEALASGQQTGAQEPRTGQGTELMFTGISVGAALLGLLLAWWFYYKQPALPQAIAHALGGLYRTVVNKYYVDELYRALLVKPLIDGSTHILWHGVDQQIIDGALHTSTQGARRVSDTFRHMQSGNLRSYAGWIATGAALVIAYMIWMGVALR